MIGPVTLANWRTPPNHRWADQPMDAERIGLTMRAIAEVRKALAKA